MIEVHVFFKYFKKKFSVHPPKWTWPVIWARHILCCIPVFGSKVPLGSEFDLWTNQTVPVYNTYIHWRVPSKVVKIPMINEYCSISYSMNFNETYSNKQRSIVSEIFEARCKLTTLNILCNADSAFLCLSSR